MERTFGMEVESYTPHSSKKLKAGKQEGDRSPVTSLTREANKKDSDFTSQVLSKSAGLHCVNVVRRRIREKQEKEIFAIRRMSSILKGYVFCRVFAYLFSVILSRTSCAFANEFPFIHLNWNERDLQNCV